MLARRKIQRQLHSLHSASIFSSHEQQKLIAFEDFKNRTVSAISSALWPVASLCADMNMDPFSKACRLKTPQYVQFPRRPVVSTTLSIVQPNS